MKKMKRILSLMLALMLTLAFAVPAYAATGDGSITINNPVDGQTYNAYRLFDLSLDAEGKHYGYTVNAEWNEFFTTGAGQEYVTIDATNGNVTLSKTTADDLQKLAQAAKEHAEKTSGITVYTPSKTDTALTFSGLPLGYYLVTSSNGTLQALDTTNKDAVVYEKNTAPDISKSADKTNAAYGDTVHFTIPVTKGGYAWGDYVINDTMVGLELKKESIQVSVNKTPLTPDTDYTVTSDANSLTVTILEATLNKRNAEDTDFVYPAGTEFVLEYDAVVKQVVHADNSVSMDYKTDPNVTTTTPTHTVKVANYEFTVKKVDEGKQPLDGAKFELHKSADCSDEAMKFIQTGTTYRLATADEANSATTDILAGEAKIEGLAAGTYYLKEVEAPAGYNKLVNPVEVKIIENLNNTEGNPYKGQAFDNNGNRLAPTIKIDDKTNLDGEFVLEVINKTGTELPSTGGIGTTIFYVVGVLLMVVAAVALIIKKRMSR